MYPLQTIIKLLRLIVSGSKLGSTPSDTDNNNQVAGLTDVYSVLDTKLEDIKTKLDNLRVDVKADDIDIGEINVDTTEIISKLDTANTALASLVSKTPNIVVLTQAQYDALTIKNANTFYYIS